MGGRGGGFGDAPEPQTGRRKALRPDHPTWHNDFRKLHQACLVYTAWKASNSNTRHLTSFPTG